jgi:hypothetical protein
MMGQQTGDQSRDGRVTSDLPPITSLEGDIFDQLAHLYDRAYIRLIRQSLNAL